MQQRRLAAIMFTDIVGYTTQMGKDEKKAFDTLRKNRRIHWRLIKKYKGKLLKEMGDGILASFSSNIDAVMCALSIQNATKELNIPLRIGIHLGDVIFENKDVLGDGVNVASRIQSSADTNGIVVSETVFNDIKNKEGIEIEFLSKRKLKGVESEIGIYKVDCKDNNVLDFTIDTGELVKPIRMEAKALIAGFLIITVLVVALYFILKNIAEPYPELDKSIAVLAFVNDSPDQENEYFCNGMWRETHNKLVLIKELSVRSQASVEQFRGTTVDMPTIGEALKVSYVLHASVSKYGDEFRIIVQLIETAMDKILWSESLGGRYNAENIFRIQTNIARNITDKLQVVLTADEEQRIDQTFTDNTESLDLTLRGNEEKTKYFMSREDKHFETSLDYFNRAIEADPDNHKAILGKGNLFSIKILHDRDIDKSLQDSIVALIHYFDKAIELNPDDPDGYMYKGNLYNSMFQHDPALENYLKAVSLAPNSAEIHGSLGNIYYNHKEDYVNGLIHLSKSLELNVEGKPGIYNRLGFCFMHTGFYERSKDYFMKVREISGDPCGGMFTYMWILISVQGKYNEAFDLLDSLYQLNAGCEYNIMLYRIENAVSSADYERAEKYYKEFIEKGYELMSEFKLTLAQLYLNTGREKEANMILGSLLSISKKQLEIEGEHWHNTLMLSQIYASLDDRDKALEYLAKFFDFGVTWGWQDMAETHPIWENFGDDPEFNAIVRRSKDEKAAIRAKILEMEERGEIDLSL